MLSVKCLRDLERYGVDLLTGESQYLLCHIAIRLPAGA